MIKWEYDISLLNVSPLTQYDKLNERGRMGWELVCVVAEYAYFKRPLIEQKPKGRRRELPRKL